MHCFDTVIGLLEYIGYSVPKSIKRRPTGKKIKNYLDSIGIKGVVKPLNTISLY